jgi:tRNA dimethylallyltransferase
MIYVILGQTASGKTGLATKLARELQLPLIGADAFQMYKELNVGSAKPTAEELEGIENYLIGSNSVTDKVSVKYYQEECRKLLDRFQAEGKDVILSGGTFLYVRAAIYPYEFIQEEENPDDGLDKLSKEEAYKKLQELDPQSAAKLDMNNQRRVVRALRICASGQKKSEIINKPLKLLYPAKFLAVALDKDEGNKRIDQRVDKMFADGLVAEVKSLEKEFDVNSLTAFQAIGYKEIIQGEKDNLTESQMADLVKQDTHQYAKRQRTFLRHQFPGLKWLKGEDLVKYVEFDSARRKRNKASIPPKALAGIEKSKVAVIGLGGVGSIVAQGLVRLGVYDLTLIDKDVVDPSNLNRQVLYDLDDIGKKKAEAAKAHLLKLDPLADIAAEDSFYKDELLEGGFDFVFDCIDDGPAKAAIYKYCLEHQIKTVAATGSGLRTDATKFRLGSLAQTGEPLARKFKEELKKIGIEDFAKVDVAYSAETPEKRIQKDIGSNIAAPNSEGLALLTFFISCF